MRCLLVVPDLSHALLCSPLPCGHLRSLLHGAILQTKDWVSTLDSVPEEDMIGSKVQLGTWLCREMDKVLDQGEKLSKGKHSNGDAIQDEAPPANRRQAVQEEMEDLMSNQERLMSMLFRVDAMRYQEYVQLNTGKLRWREAVQGTNLKKSGSTRGNARTIMFSVMKVRVLLFFSFLSPDALSTSGIVVEFLSRLMSCCSGLKSSDRWGESKARAARGQRQRRVWRVAGTFPRRRRR